MTCKNTRLFSRRHVPELDLRIIYPRGGHSLSIWRESHGTENIDDICGMGVDDIQGLARGYVPEPYSATSVPYGQRFPIFRQRHPLDCQSFLTDDESFLPCSQIPDRRRSE